MRIGPVTLLIGGLLFLAIRKAKKDYDYVEFSPLGFKLGTLGILSTSITYTFQVKNPTTSTATVKNIFGKIMAGNTQVGTYSIPQPFTIPQRGAVTLNTQVNLSNFEFLKTLVAAIKDRKAPEIRFDGNIGTGIGTFPFSYVASVQRDLTLKKK